MLYVLSFQRNTGPLSNSNVRLSSECKTPWVFDNVIAMIPFCRTLEEADKVLEVMADSMRDVKKRIAELEQKRN